MKFHDVKNEFTDRLIVKKTQLEYAIVGKKESEFWIWSSRFNEENRELIQFSVYFHCQLIGFVSLLSVAFIWKKDRAEIQIISLLGGWPNQ